jgi:phage terminase Nu1 subunit (DNA packaging protein)
MTLTPLCARGPPEPGGPPRVTATAPDDQRPSFLDGLRFGFSDSVAGLQRENIFSRGASRKRFRTDGIRDATTAPLENSCGGHRSVRIVRSAWSVRTPMPTVNVTKVASALNLDPRRVQQLVKEGMPRVSRGQYDPVKCMVWYIRYLQRAIEKKTVPTIDGGFVSERMERLRLLRADADLKEMELAKERSQLVALPDVEAILIDLVLTTKARIMAIPPRLAPELVGETSRVMIQAKLEKAYKESLAYLAKERNGGSTDASKLPS